MLKIAVVSVLAGSLMCSAPLGAQQAPTPEQVHEYLPPRRSPLPAELLEADSSRTGEWLSVAADSRYSLDLASGEGVPRWLRGVVYGMGVGAVVGGATGVLISFSDGEAGAGDGYVPEWFANLVTFGGAGTVVGGLIGGLVGGS